MVESHTVAIGAEKGNIRVRLWPKGRTDTWDMSFILTRADAERMAADLLQVAAALPVEASAADFGPMPERTSAEIVSLVPSPEAA